MSYKCTLLSPILGEGGVGGGRGGCLQPLYFALRYRVNRFFALLHFALDSPSTTMQGSLDCGHHHTRTRSGDLGSRLKCFAAHTESRKLVLHDVRRREGQLGQHHSASTTIRDSEEGGGHQLATACRLAAFDRNQERGGSYEATEGSHASSLPGHDRCTDEAHLEAVVRGCLEHQLHAPDPDIGIGDRFQLGQFHVHLMIGMCNHLHAVVEAQSKGPGYID